MSARAALIRACAAVAVAGWAGAALGQPVPLERGPLERPALPRFLPETPRPGFVLPPAPAAPRGRAGPPLRLQVSRFRFEGVTAFAIKDLEEVVAPYVGRLIGAEELEEARLAVTRHYIAAGYVNSGALIPDQAVDDGTVLIRVVEGRLAAVEVRGSHQFDPSYVRDRLALGAGVPLNVRSLQERMQVMLLNPQLERMNAELAAGEQPGDAVLRVDVAEAKRHSVGAGYANNRSPAVGGERFEVNASTRNTFGRGEIFSLRAGEARGLEDVAATLVAPVSARDTLLTLKYESVDSVVVEPPFDLLDIRNHSEMLEIGLSEPFYRSTTRELAAGAALVRRRNASTLLGQPFSFVPGLASGKSTVSALRLSGDWAERSASQVVAARLTYTQGLDAFGSTVSDAGNPDSRFRAWLAQLQWVQRLGPRAGYTVVRGDWQAASEALLPSEKFAVGGAGSVRGYRENALVRDNGWAASLEYRLEVARYAPFSEEDATAGPVEVALFGDAGAAREAGGEWRQLSSLGWGLRWQPWRGALAQVYKGHAGTNLPAPTRTRQDAGWHFLFQVQKDF